MHVIYHGKIRRGSPSWVHEQTRPPGQSQSCQKGNRRELRLDMSVQRRTRTSPRIQSAHARGAGTRTFFAFHSPSFHFASGQISGTSLPLCVQGSTVQSSLVLLSLITAVLCGPSVNSNRRTGAAVVLGRSKLRWS